uniref:Uncharacterized protein n=1 Tax=Palpitomonas bilix TaxID=652834 RepID=A0A7S3DA32_9EUKA
MRVCRLYSALSANVKEGRGARLGTVSHCEGLSEARLTSAPDIVSISPIFPSPSSSFLTFSTCFSPLRALLLSPLPLYLSKWRGTLPFPPLPSPPVSPKSG